MMNCNALDNDVCGIGIGYHIVDNYMLIVYLIKGNPFKDFLMDESKLTRW